MSKHERQGGTGVKERQRSDLKEPPLYNVIILNDDFTPQDFVVGLLEQVFRHPPARAKQIMLHVHNNGSGIAGKFTREVAETKAEISKGLAAKYGYPLQLTYEPA